MDRSHEQRRGPTFLIAAMALSACGGDVLGPQEELEELPRDLTAVEGVLIERANDFGLDLLREVVDTDDRPNIVLSPLSASLALGMTLNGADGATFDAMRSTLGFDGLDQQEINEAYRGLVDLLRSLDESVQVEIANSVWANQDVPFHSSFFDAVAEAFDAAAESRDFSDAATLDAINGWVSENTDGLIDSIVDGLDPALVMLLLNAIYFDGAWTTEFDPDRTAERSFTRADGSSVQVDMMSMSDIEVPFAWGTDHVAAELPYGAGAYAMLVLVPGGDVADFVATLDAVRWNEIVASLNPTEVDALSLPKLDISYDAYLNAALRSLGMGQAFEPGADFTRMSPAGDGLCIDFVRQKTVLEVDERGTWAAAVTGVGIGPTSFIGLVADRPFVLAIRERLSGTILFVGVIGDPTASDSGPEPYDRTCA